MAEGEIIQVIGPSVDIRFPENQLPRILNAVKVEYPDKKILAIIGAGHEDDILELIKKPGISYSFKIG